jgi:hypothetical protein
VEAIELPDRGHVGLLLSGHIFLFTRFPIGTHRQLEKIVLRIRQQRLVGWVGLLLLTPHRREQGQDRQEGDGDDWVTPHSGL